MQLLYPKEEDIMYAIWDIGHPCVIFEILKAHPELKRNTVAKVLKLLEQKGYLVVDSIVKTVTRTGRAYAPIIKKADYEAQKALMNNITESSGALDGILNYCSTLVDTEMIDDEFIQEMDKLIHEFKSRREE